MTTKTPQRPSSSNNNNNNYAAPHTPIASAKRPRSSMDNKGVVKTPSRILNKDEYRDEALSPMHPPQPPRPIVEEEEEEDEENSSWVNRKMDALFSPVLSFLGSSNREDENEDQHEQPPRTPEEQMGEYTHNLNGHNNINISNNNFTPNQNQTQNDHNHNHNENNTTTSTTNESTPPNQNAIQHPQTSTPSVMDEDAQMVTEPSSLEEDDDLPDDAPDDEEEPQHQHGREHQQEHDDEEEDEFNPYVFIKSLPHYDDVKHFRPPVALPKKSSQSPPITLVLDLDETLVHCTVEHTNESDLTFPVLFHGMEYQVHVKLRPHLFEFLEKIHDKFEVVVFTASQKVYADELLDRIDPDKKYIKYRMFRESCLPVEGNFLKDLSVCGRALEKTVLVDNSPHAFGYQMDNGIPIESWFDDPTDTELLKLELFLRTLQKTDDVRKLVRRQFKTYQKVADAGHHHHHYMG